MPFNRMLRLSLQTGAAFGLSIGIASGALAQTPSAPVPGDAKAPNVETCRTTVDRIARLECFDIVFNVSIPKPPPDPPVFPPVVKPQMQGPIRTIAQQQERARDADRKGWLMRFRPWASNGFFPADAFRDIRVSSANQEPADTDNRHQWTETNTDVFLTQREADVSAEVAAKSLEEKALLMAACENDITTLYVILPKPVNDPRTRLTLSSDRGTEFSVKWRDVEQGNVISAGRGLESIDFLKSIASFKRIQLQLRDGQEERAFVFDVEDLPARLSPLRTACHW